MTRRKRTGEFAGFCFGNACKSFFKLEVSNRNLYYISGSLVLRGTSVHLYFKLKYAFLRRIMFDWTFLQIT
jgi:hypothetical protein